MGDSVTTLTIEGKRFGRLAVIENKIINHRGYSICKCDCGKIATIRNDALKSGVTKSCGCITKEIAKSGKNRRKHGLHNTRLHRIWGAMKTRCCNENFKRFSDYGGRGITVCDEWKNDFMSFYKWSIENGYSDKLTIDRINVNGNYEPSNCRWATVAEQNKNKRNSKERKSK